MSSPKPSRRRSGSSSSSVARTPTALPAPAAASPPSSPPFSYPASYASSEPFTQPHTVSVLMLVLGGLVYSLSQHDVHASRASNVTTGVIAAACVALVFATEHLRDTLFIRPHPALWRATTGLGLIYWCLCTFLLFQDVGDIRSVIMPALDGSLKGTPLPHRSYGDACELTWPNVEAALWDEFVIAHAVGWVFKALAFRDLTLSFATSFLFELMEYTFTYLQPNFSECWWDHWLLDFAICNTGGILLAHALLANLNGRVYNWSGAPVARALTQFTPLHASPYHWHMFSDVRRFGYVLLLLAGCMMVELDAFFLKDIFWVPSTSYLNVARLVLWWPMSMVGLRDYYAFMVDPGVKRLGSAAWIMLATMVTEFLVVLRFGVVHYAGKRMPTEIAVAWGVTLAAASIGLVLWFGFIQPRRRRAAAMVSSSKEQ